METLRSSIRILTAICAVIALAECTAGEEEADGLRLIGGAAAALSIVRMIASLLSGL